MEACGLNLIAIAVDPGRLVNGKLMAANNRLL